jgi:alkaline phosphatase
MIPNSIKASLLASLASASGLCAQSDAGRGDSAAGPAAARSCVFFIGDGMGVSTVSATRVMSVGIEGRLVLDHMPFTALSRTADADSITPDSASTMTAMVTGVQTNSGVIGLDATTEFNDFNKDGDGARLTTILELAKAAGKSVGVISTARVTHATPAACYAKVNNRDQENAIALQALPGDPTFNGALGTGMDLIMGGGRRFFVPNTVVDEEGERGARGDGRDLRIEFQQKGYTYVWNRRQLSQLGLPGTPVLALFDSSHMEYEWDRPLDTAGEPSLAEMTSFAVRFLSQNPNGFFLMVESGRIDHAHHAGNAFRALYDAEELDEAVLAAASLINLNDTLLMVTADHSHVFNIAGYPSRPLNELSYPVKSAPDDYRRAPFSGLFSVVYEVNAATGDVVAATDANGAPYTILGYLNGPGYRNGPRVDPRTDPFKGMGGAAVRGPSDPNYVQEAAVPLGSETHSGEDVALYAIGAGASLVNGTVRNSFTLTVMRTALGL